MIEVQTIAPSAHRLTFSAMDPKPTPEFNAGYYDRANERAQYVGLSHNLQRLYPENRYSVDMVQVNSEAVLLSNPGELTLYVLQKGPAQGRFVPNIHGENQIPADASFEALKGGDVVAVLPDTGVHIRPDSNGAPIKFWALSVSLDAAPNSDYRLGITKLDNLQNEVGGCNDGSIANPQRDFRRLAYSSHTKFGPGSNLPIEIHTVLINPSTSEAHYHPMKSIGGPLPQHELYLVLDAAERGLILEGNGSQISLYRRPGDEQFIQYSEFVSPNPGTAFSIPRGVGHHATGLICVVALPGFYGKQNEISLGQHPVYPAA